MITDLEIVVGYIVLSMQFPLQTAMQNLFLSGKQKRQSLNRRFYKLWYTNKILWITVFFIAVTQHF